MPISLQDFKKGIDLTGLPSITASQINDLIDDGTPADDRGLILETTDTALNTPAVPNAAVTVKFKRYIWKRIIFTTAAVKLYFWDESVVSDATFLKWVELNASVAEVIELVNAATALANDAVNDANNALSTSQTAQSIAQQALDVVNSLNNTVTTLQTSVTNLQTQVNNAVYQPGDYRRSAADLSYSTSTDEGWLKCNGAAVSRTTFARLFAKIGTAYGVGDGVNTFNVPRADGRSPMASGTGDGLTPRVLGTFVGEENHVLTQEELPNVNFHVNNADRVGASLQWAHFDAGGESYSVNVAKSIQPNTGGGALTTLEAASGGTDAGHNTVHPVLIDNVYIKT